MKKIFLLISSLVLLYSFSSQLYAIELKEDSISAKIEITIKDIAGILEEKINKNLPNGCHYKKFKMSNTRMMPIDNKNQYAQFKTTLNGSYRFICNIIPWIPFTSYITGKFFIELDKKKQILSLKYKVTDIKDFFDYLESKIFKVKEITKIDLFKQDIVIMNNITLSNKNEDLIITVSLKNKKIDVK